MPHLYQSALALALSLAALPAAQAEGLTLQTRDGVQLGFLLFGYDYRETVKGEEFMSTTGNKLGVSFNYTNTLKDDRFLTLDFRYSNGQVAYNGSGTGTATENSVDLRLLGGMDFPRKGYTLTPFSGLGHRTLHNNLAGYTTTAAAGYRRDSTYVYLPLGVTHRFEAGKGRVAATLEYDYLIQGTQVSHVSDLGASGDLNNTQRNGRGLRLSVAYEETNWSAIVFYNLWKIEDSDVSTFVIGNRLYGGYEPQNTTKELGAEVKYKF